MCGWAAILWLQADVENQGKPAKAKIDKTKAVPRAAAGQKWYDATLSEWPENDFRIFVGDMGNEVNDDILTKAFTKYASFQKAKIVRDKHSNKSKGMIFSIVLYAAKLPFGLMATILCAEGAQESPVCDDCNVHSMLPLLHPLHPCGLHFHRGSSRQAGLVFLTLI